MIKAFSSYIFQAISEKLPEEHSLAKEISAVLDINLSSAYRKIAGIVPLSLEETFLLSEKYGVSIDGFKAEQSKQVVMLLPQADRKEDWEKTPTLERLAMHFDRLTSLDGVKLTCWWQDSPFLHFMQFPELTAFKLELWKIAGTNELPPFSLRLPADTNALRLKVMQHYYESPSEEFMHENMLHYILSQIQYFRELGNLADTQADLLKSQLQDLIDGLRRMSTDGKKHFRNGHQTLGGGPFTLYHNRIVPMHNTIRFEADGFSACLFNWFRPHFLLSTNPEIQGMMRKRTQFMRKFSNRISEEATLERNLFFSRLNKKMEEFG